MLMNVASLVVGIAGLIFGVWGLLKAEKQNVISEHLKKILSENKAKREYEIWTQIGINLTAFDALDECLLNKSTIVDQDISRKIENARRAIIDLYRLLLGQAVAIEPDFTMDTIRKWHNAGRLENEWRVRAAMRLLPTREIPDDVRSVDIISAPTNDKTGKVDCS